MSKKKRIFVSRLSRYEIIAEKNLITGITRNPLLTPAASSSGKLVASSSNGLDFHWSIGPREKFRLIRERLDTLKLKTKICGKSEIKGGKNKIFNFKKLTFENLLSNVCKFY